MQPFLFQWFICRCYGNIWIYKNNWRQFWNFILADEIKQLVMLLYVHEGKNPILLTPKGLLLVGSTAKKA